MAARAVQRAIKKLGAATKIKFPNDFIGKLYIETKVSKPFPEPSQLYCQDSKKSIHKKERTAIKKIKILNPSNNWMLKIYDLTRL